KEIIGTLRSHVQEAGRRESQRDLYGLESRFGKPTSRGSANLAEHRGLFVSRQKKGMFYLE
ncbi:MAG TPA: hypothetical protein VGO47_11985, partial [Chlamydiales bacterium]|nr:hypothetical protein [Chlamydiales bacterium]